MANMALTCVGQDLGQGLDQDLGQDLILARILGRLGLRVPINAVQNSASALNSPATILANSIGSDHSCSALQPDPRNAPTSVSEVAAPQSRPCGVDQGSRKHAFVVRTGTRGAARVLANQIAIGGADTH